jgi:hypothetical protein
VGYILWACDVPAAQIKPQTVVRYGFLKGHRVGDLFGGQLIGQIPWTYDAFGMARSRDMSLMAEVWKALGAAKKDVAVFEARRQDVTTESNVCTPLMAIPPRFWSNCSRYCANLVQCQTSEAISGQPTDPSASPHVASKHQHGESSGHYVASGECGCLHDHD